MRAPGESYSDVILIKIPIRFSEGKPNLEAREDIKITDTAPMGAHRGGRTWRPRTGATALELARS
jgi:hypothetical protein